MNFIKRLRDGLKKTRNVLGDGVARVIFGHKQIDDELLDEIETILLQADVGVDASQEIIDRLTEQLARKELKDSECLLVKLKEDLMQILEPCQKPLQIDMSHKPYVIVMVGVNGVGKTTTIGKLAKKLQAEGKSVMLAAGDTFRAAAIEQLQVWGARNKIPVVAQHTGADSASVVFDAIKAAKAKGTDVVIADTAGRLHTKNNLMNELEKILRVIKKIDDSAPHEIMLVLDATNGQNALSQAVQFHNVANVSGLAITKLDGTAKGGIVFAIAKKLGIPIRFIGVGEKIEDLQEFDKEAFVTGLF